FQYVVDQQNVPARDFVVDVAQDLDLAARSARAVAGDEDELHFRRQADIVHGPDKVGREDERPLEHRDDEQVLVVLARDLLSEFQIAPRNRRRREQHLDLLASDHRHARPYSPKLTDTILTPLVGALRRPEKANVSPDRSGW